MTTLLNILVEFVRSILLMEFSIILSISHGRLIPKIYTWMYRLQEIHT